MEAPELVIEQLELLGLSTELDICPLELEPEVTIADPPEDPGLTWLLLAEFV